jgi:6-phosphogluconolactonase
MKLRLVYAGAALAILGPAARAAIVFDEVVTLIEHVPSQGRSPRNFAFDPSHRWLIVTNHGSDNAMVFRVDENTGYLSPVGRPVHVLYPFGVRFLPVP